MTVSRERFPEIDFLRGLSVIAMVLFHLFWDLVYFDLVPWDLFGVDPLVIAQTIGASFQLIAGISLSISYARQTGGTSTGGFGKRYVVRGLKLMAWATVVSLVVYFTVDMPIFFGILHLIGSAIILSPLFLPRPLLAGVVGIVIIAATRWLAALPVRSWWLLPLGIGEGTCVPPIRSQFGWCGFTGIWLAQSSTPAASGFHVLGLERITPCRGRPC